MAVNIALLMDHFTMTSPFVIMNDEGQNIKGYVDGKAFVKLDLGPMSHQLQFHLLPQKPHLVSCSL